jgi:ribosomal protein S18 acetylase RimI-like enzyme
LVIELLAVDQEYRGKAIGSSLISTLKKIAHEKQLCEIEVVTQGINLRAIKFYTKNKFKLRDTQYIFHYWNPKKYEYTI